MEQLPDFEDYAMTNRTYRYFQGEPLYPFGYGLSYSKFEYSNLKLPGSELKAGDPLPIGVDIKNASDRGGDEVVEVYLSFPKVPGTPMRALRAFKRIHMEAGQSSHADFTLQPRDLSYVNESGDRLVGGEYIISVGGGQPGTQATHADAHLSIHGEQKLPE